MHRSERLEILLRRLVDRPGITVQSLCSELGVSPRSLYRDLKLLRDKGYPIDGSVGKGGGLRLHPSYGLGKIQLSVEQSLAILLSVAIGEKLNLPFFAQDLKPSRQKITAAFSSTQRAIIRRLQERIFIGAPASKEVALSYSNPVPEVTRIIQKSFFNEKALTIKYINEKKEVSCRMIEPHGIFVNFPAWYLISFDHLRNVPRTFRLDRIIEAKVNEQSFRPQAEKFFVELVGNVFGSSL